MALDATVRGILAGAPDLIHTPSLAVGAAQAVQADPTGTLDPQATAASLQVAAGNVGLQQGVQDIGLSAGAEDVSAPTTSTPVAAPTSQPKPHHRGIFGTLMHYTIDPVVQSAKEDAHIVGQGLTDLNNATLGEVQHVYRSDHESIQRYGVMGWLEQYFPGLRSHAAAEQNKQAWKVTANGSTYRDRYGNAVNPGFDFANLVDHVVNGHNYLPAGWTRDANGVMQPTPQGGVDLPTGIVNAVFDLALDPVMKGARFAQGAKLAGLTSGGRVVDLALDPAVRAKQLEDLAESGQHIAFTEDPNKALVGTRVLYQGRAVRPLVDFDGNRASNVFDVYQNNKGVNYAFNRLAQLDTADIVKQYPMLRPLAAELGNAQTGEDVAKVMHDAITVRNYSFNESGLPATGITRRTVEQLTGRQFQTLQGAASDVIDASPKIVRQAFSYKPFTLDSRTMQLSGHEFDPDDPASLAGIRNVLLYSQSRKVANAVVANYLETPELGQRISILTNAFRDTLRAAGVPDESDLMLRWRNDIDFLNKNAIRPVYGMDEDGQAVHLVDPETGEPLSLGLFNNQTGKIAFPDFNEMRKAIADSRPGWDPRKVGFKVDDWLYNHYTARIFKNLVLLSLGFGLRVAAGELTPAILATNTRRVAGSAAMAAAAKLNPTLADLAAEHADGLVGLDAQTARHGLGKVAAVDGENGRVTVEYGDGTQREHNASTVTLLHRPIKDEDLMAQARKLGVQVSGDELPHYKAAISKALFGVGKALVDKDYYDQAVFNVMTLGGHAIAPGLMSNHDVLTGGAGYTEDLRDYLRQAGARIPDKPQRMTDHFTTYDADNDRHPMFWHFAIQEASKDPGVQAGAQAYLRAIRRGATKDQATAAFVRADTKWMRSDSDVAEQFRYKMAGHGQGADAYSGQRAAAVRGLAYGKNGQLNEDVLAALAGRADVPNVASLAERDAQLRPLAVKGRELADVPDIGNFERITRFGWRKALHPTINSMSRAPLYTLKTAEEYKFLKPWVDNGLLDEAGARQIAQVRGAQGMLPLVHNTKLRSQMSELFRNIVPFYFAQEQAYKRYGRVMVKDPIAFRKAMLALHGLGNSGIIRQDSEGQQHIVIPGAGEFAKWWTDAAQAVGLPVMGGLPSVMSGSTISLKSVVPEANLPSTSPLVAVPLKAIQSWFPQTEPLINKAIGPVAEAESSWDELIPNATLKRVLQATPLLDRESAFSTSFMYSLAWANHEATVLRDKAAVLPASDPRKAQLLAQANRLFPDANADIATKQNAWDRLRNSTRILTLAKALVGMVSPLSPSIDVGDVKLRTELRQEIQAHGLANGVQEFTRKNPTATADTVFLSDSSYTGSALPATGQALKWVDNNMAWAKNHVLAAAYLIPQAAGKYNQEAYNQELALGLRQRKTPQQMVNAIYAAATNSTFFADVKKYDTAKQQYTNDSVMTKALRQSWAQYTQQLSNANPVWYADLNDSNKQMVAQEAFQQVRQALADPHTPYSPQTGVIAGLVQDYENYSNMVQAARQGRTNVTVTALQDSWKQYLDDQATKVPEASAFIHGVLRRLP